MRADRVLLGEAVGGHRSHFMFSLKDSPSASFPTPNAQPSSPPSFNFLQRDRPTSGTWRLLYDRFPMAACVVNTESAGISPKSRKYSA